MAQDETNKNKRRVIMPEGRCKNCGAKYYGWALKYMPSKPCEKCGGEIEITKEG